MSQKIHHASIVTYISGRRFVSVEEVCRTYQINNSQMHKEAKKKYPDNKEVVKRIRFFKIQYLSALGSERDQVRTLLSLQSVEQKLKKTRTKQIKYKNELIIKAAEQAQAFITAQQDFALGKYSGRRQDKDRSTFYVS